MANYPILVCLSNPVDVRVYSWPWYACILIASSSAPVTLVVLTDNSSYPNGNKMVNKVLRDSELALITESCRALRELSRSS